MTATIAGVFSTEAISERVEAFAKDSLRGNIWTDLFSRYGRRIEAPYDQATWDEITFGRALAPSVGHGTPAPVRANLSSTKRTMAPCVLKLAKIIPPDLLWKERNPGSLLPNAQARMEMEERELVQLIRNAIEYLCAGAVLGTTTVNNTTMPGTTIPFTITWGNNTYTATASWATPGTSLIGAELFALKTDFEQTSGLQPAQVICGGTVEQYLAQNTEVQNLLMRQAGIQLAERASPLRGPGVAGFNLGGLTWTVTEQGFLPDGGAFTRYLGANADIAIVLPSNGELQDVLGMVEGVSYVPVAPYAQMNPGSPMDPTGLMRPKAGWSAYAMLVDGPAIKLVVQYCGLPVVVRPAAIQVVDTTP